MNLKQLLNIIKNEINNFNEKIYLPLIFAPEINNKLPTIIIMPNFFQDIIHLNFFTDNLIIDEYFIIYNNFDKNIILQLIIDNFCIQIYLSNKDL